MFLNLPSTLLLCEKSTHDYLTWEDLEMNTTIDEGRTGTLNINRLL
jgi:hypothetical protein